MTSRYVPNEPASSVSLDTLALLLRSDEARIAQILGEFPMVQRAVLAAFCFSRCHMRSLSFKIASHCDERSLRKAGGPSAEILIEQSRSPSTFDVGPLVHQKRKVTLARFG
ncbi:MAG TPA: hypothetical protein VGN97_03040 [Mesorhizobium sp.]|jgi:hypothetical protein|nr:hypothetical protein [Mesorhizobium sp.]